MFEVCNQMSEKNSGVDAAIYRQIRVKEAN